MISTIFAIQQFLNSQHNAGLVEDGIPGPRTEAADRCAYSLRRRSVLGCIPYEWGRASHYGGPDDAGDYYEGQSFFPSTDPDGGGPKPARHTPSQYYHDVVSDDVRPYLRAEMGDADRWPVINGRPVGVSYYLNTGPCMPTVTDGVVEPIYYAAARLSGDMLRRARAGEAIYLRVYNPAIVEDGRVRSVLVRVIDWGPTAVWTASLARSVGRPELVGTPWRFKIDLSPGAYKALGLGPGADRVWWEVL